MKFLNESGYSDEFSPWLVHPVGSKELVPKLGARNGGGG